jgi:nicotinamide-nucleotide amidase
LENDVIPYLRRRFDLHQVIKARILRTAALGESRIDTILSELLTGTNPTVGLSAHPGQTDVRITAKGDSEEEADRLIAPVEAEVRRLLGPIVYGTDKETVEEVLLRDLSKAGLMLVAAESGTGGLLTNRLSTAPGTEAAFYRGFVANDPSALGKALGVASESDASSDLNEFAHKLANLLATTSDSIASRNRLGLVVLTLPHHTGEAATSAGGSIISLATPDGVQVRQSGYGGHSAHAATWATTHAMEMARRWLVERGG